MKAIHNWRGTGWPKTKVVNDLIYRNNESNSQQEAEQKHTEIVVNDLIYRNNESNSQLPAPNDLLVSELSMI